MKTYGISTIVALVLFGIIYFILSSRSADTYVAIVQGDYEAKYTITDPSYEYDKPTYHVNDSFIQIKRKPFEQPFVSHCKDVDVYIDKDAKVKFMSGDSLRAFLNQYYDPNTMNAYYKAFIKKNFTPRIFQTDSWYAGEQGPWFLIVPFLFLVTTIVIWFNTKSKDEEEDAKDGRNLLSLCTFSCVLTALTAAWVYTGLDVYYEYNHYWDIFAVFLLVIVALVIGFAMLMACFGALSRISVINGAVMSLKEFLKAFGCGFAAACLAQLCIVHPLGMDNMSMEANIIIFGCMALSMVAWLLWAYKKNRTSGIKYLPEIIICMLFLVIAAIINIVAVIGIFIFKYFSGSFFVDLRGFDRINPNKSICSQCRRELQGCDKTCLISNSHCNNFVHKDGGVE